MGINSYTIVNRVEAAAAKTYTVLGPINLTTGTSVPLSGSALYVTQLEIYGYKSASNNTLPVNNTDPCYVTGMTTAGSRFPVDQIPAGGKITYLPESGTKFNLAEISVLGSTNDAVYVKYLQ